MGTLGLLDRTPLRRRRGGASPRTRPRRPRLDFGLACPEALEARALLSTVPGAIGTIPALTEPASAVGDWTLMVYITATDLTKNAPDNIMEMERVAANMPDSVRIVVLYDQWANDDGDGNQDPDYRDGPPTSFPTGNGSQPAWTTAGIGLITGGTPAGSSGIATQFDISATEVDTGSEQTLTNFVYYASMLAPAGRYALILWDHGGGVTENNNDTYDMLPKNNLTTTRVASALNSARQGGIELDLLAYDECQMATTEVAYAMRNLVPVLVGSEENIDGPGYNYETALSILTTNPAQVTPDALASSMVLSFEARYGHDDSYLDTLSATNLGRIEGLTAALGNFVASTSSARVGDWEAMIQAWEYSPAYGSAPRFSYRDLGQFLGKVADSKADPSIRFAAEVALAALESAVFARTDDTRDSKGLSIYFPVPLVGIVPEYRTEVAASGFEAETGWLGFLERFYAALQRTPPPVPSSWAYNNSGPSSALKLGTQVGAMQRVPGLMIRGGETNWFRFDTLYPGRLRNAVRMVTSAQASRLMLRLYDANAPTTPITEGLRAASLRFLPPGEYLLAVTSPSERVAGRYNVWIDAPRTLRGRPDLPAGNGTIETAKNLGTVGGTNFFSGLSRSASTPHAWFKFATPRSEDPYTATVILLSDGQPLTLDLLDEQGNLLGRTRGRNTLTLNYEATGSAGSYHLRVSGYPGAYSLMFTG